MTSVALLEPILGGVRATNFFNGRLLSAEDLSAEQSALRQVRAQLGRAIGDGVVFGLEVSVSTSSTPATPAVTVQPGLAVNRFGYVLSLEAPTAGVDVTLAGPGPNAQAAPAPNSPFAECLPAQPGVYVAGTLIYLLVMAPAAGGEGRVPLSGAGGIAPTSATRSTVEGVQFRLLPFEMSADDLADTDRLRNLVAHACFGTHADGLAAVGAQALLDLASDPFGAPVPARGYGALDKLRVDGQLTDCDVPLAVLHWTSEGGVEFVDMWSARRRLTRRGLNEPWPLALADRRLAEAEAMLAQFQQHLVEVRARLGQPGSVVASDVFRYLPPVGLLPISAPGAAPAFDLATFFGIPVVYRGPAVVDAARFEALIRAALPYAPIDLDDEPSVWLYRVRENAPLVSDTDGAPPAPYVVFTTAHMPFQGQARFNEARLEYGVFVS